MQPQESPEPPQVLRERGIAWENVIFIILTWLVGGWIVASVVGLQGIMWVIEQTIIAGFDRPMPGGSRPFIAAGVIVLVAIPSALIGMLAARFAPEARAIPAAARAWTAAALFGGALGVVRAVPIEHNELYLLLLAVVAVALALVQRGGTRLRAWLRARGERQTASPKADSYEEAEPKEAEPKAPPVQLSRLAGAVAGIVTLLPWLVFGALGGLTETVLAAVAAAAVGWLASGVLDARFFAAFATGRARAIGLGGMAAGVALVPLASGIGASGPQLLEMLVLPPLGFALAALAVRAWPTINSSGTAWLVGVASFGPLAFVDPEEVSLLLGTRDVAFWAVMAALGGIVIAAAVGTAYSFIFVPTRSWRRPTSLGTAAVVAIVAAGAYVVAGQPGLHGERLFVILKEQADLSGIAQLGDRNARASATYERLTSTAERSQASLRRALDKWHLDYTPYYLVNGISVEGGPLIRQWLSSRDDVDRVLLEEELRPLPEAAPTPRGDAPAPSGQPQWNIQLIEADKVWNELGVTGTGVTIGSSDSGVDGAHPALSQGFRGGDDSWYDPWNHTTTPVDHNGHGTHTTGTAVGRDGVGVAPGASWMGCVNLDRNLGSPANYLNCLQFMLAPFPTGGDAWRDGRPDRAPQILTNSWGCPWLEGCDTRSLAPAAAAFRAAGIYFVAAAGNSGLAGCGSIADLPALYADVTTVGAVNANRALADFSSVGPTVDGLTKPDVLAPGVNVLSAFPGGTWQTEDGTSMATPHVAGVVALMWAAQPKLVGDIDTTTRILRETATTAQPTPGRAAADAACGDANLYGSGIVDAYAAVKAAKALQ